MTVTCDCCGKPVADVQDLEPAFGLPDIVAALPAADRKRIGAPGPDKRAMLSPDVCFLDYDHEDRNRRACYLRIVVPFAVINRPALPVFRWGAWVQVEDDVMRTYVEAAAQDAGTAPPAPLDLQPEYECQLANDIGRRIGAQPSFMAPMRLVPKRGSQRWQAYFVDLEHRLTDLQRRGITVSQVLSWNKPLHSPPLQRNP